MEATTAKVVDQDFALDHVAQGSKKGFFSMLVVMLGFTFFSASMWAGGKLGAGVTFNDFFLSVLAGNLILGLYTGALAYIAASTGLSTHLLARYSFGAKGSYLPSFLLSFTQVGWFGVGVAMFAIPIAKATGWNVNALIIIGGLLMTSSAWFGIKALTILSFIAVPAIAVLGCYSVTDAIGTFGFDALQSVTPIHEMSLFAAIGICVGSFISGGTLTPDFTRFAKTKKVAVSTTVIAFFLGNTLMFIFGAVGAALYQLNDISDVLVKQGMIVLGMVVLGLNIWTTNDNALYASGLGLSNVTGLPKKWVVIFNGIIGTIFAMWLYNNFVGWLSTLNVMLPSIGAVIIADFFVVNKGKYLSMAQMKTDQVNGFKAIRIPALLAWGIGVAVALLTEHGFIGGITPLNATIVSLIVYPILVKLIK